MELKESRKRTEVGALPENWSVVPLKDLLRRAPAYGINAAATPLDSRFPTYLRITDITGDGRFSSVAKASVDHPASFNYFLEEGDLVFARTGASVGKTYRYRPEDGLLVYAGFLIRLSPNAEKLNPIFLSYVSQTKFYWNWVKVNSMRSGQPGINGREYAALPIPLPPTISEQQAIAEALSDADALIESLEQLLVKKRQIKQGTMQELLTGKRRLPGYSTTSWNSAEIGLVPNDWKVVTIGAVAAVKTGPFGSSLHESDYVDEGTPIITVEHLGERGIVSTKTPLVSEIDRQRLCKYSLQVGDIVFSRVGSIDRNARVSEAEEGWLFSGRLLRVRADCKRVETQFLSYQFHGQPFKSRVHALAVGQTMASLNTQILKQVLILLPSLAEQTAIATILSDMDADIAALEAKLAKARHIKQGMMQQLLTGQIRLV